jgi:transposase-like protein
VAVSRWIEQARTARYRTIQIQADAHTITAAPRPCRHAPGDRWFADETYVKVAGKWTYLYWAIHQYGQGRCCVGRS